MEWVVVTALLVFMAGLGVVTSHALKHAASSRK